MQEAVRDTTNPANDAARWDEIEPHLNEALARLRPQERDALLIRFFDGASLAETGQRLGIGENAARMRVTRALDRTRVLLRQAGFVVPIALLAALLESHSAQAAPSTVLNGIARLAAAPPAGTFIASTSGAASAAASQGGIMSLGSIKTVAVVTGACLVGWGGMQAARTLRPAASPKAATSTMAARQIALDSFTGTWAGTLTYRDYQSGRRVTMGTRWTVTPSKKDSAVLDLVQEYPGQRTDTGQITFDLNGKYREIERDGTTFVSNVQGGLTSLTAWANGTQNMLVLFRDGTDEGTPARIRQTFTRQAGKLTLLKEAQPKGSQTYAFRNQYVLERQTPAPATTLNAAAPAVDLGNSAQPLLTGTQAKDFATLKGDFTIAYHFDLNISGNGTAPDRATIEDTVREEYRRAGADVGEDLITRTVEERMATAEQAQQGQSASGRIILSGKGGRLLYEMQAEKEYGFELPVYFALTDGNQTYYRLSGGAGSTVKDGLAAQPFYCLPVFFARYGNVVFSTLR